MVEILGVKFNSAGKTYYFDPIGHTAAIGDHVLVETARGVEMGKVVIANKMVAEEEIIPPLKPIIRIATEADFRQAEENKEKEKEAFTITVEKIAEHHLDMKLVDAEYTFDRSKLLFYFTADGRVDFRELVKSLAGIFRTRIELRQIGVRDEARQLGSYGICGRYLCCSGFLNDFHPVSIKMAKEQGLSLNPTKISGVCGRLMCCLQYEQNVYDDMLKKMPRRGEKVSTPDGIGTVADTATLKGQIRVKFLDDNDDLVKFENYKLGEFQPLSKRSKLSAKQKDAAHDLKSDIADEMFQENTAAEKENNETPSPSDAQSDRKDAGEPKPRRRRRRRGGKKNAAGNNPQPREESQNTVKKTPHSHNGGYHHS